METPYPWSQFGSAASRGVAVVQSHLGARMAAHSEVVLRQRVCRASGCNQVFWICRHCDRGQHYCSSLRRQQTRRQQHRLANRRHQQSLEGRQDHRDRQRAYRRRHLRTGVTDVSSQGLSSESRIRPRCALAVRLPHAKGNGTLLAGSIERKQQFGAKLLYYLYSLNIPRLGDVVTMLARPKVRNDKIAPAKQF